MMPSLGGIIAVIGIPALVIGLLVNKGCNAVTGSDYDSGYERGVQDCREGKVRIETDTTVTYRVVTE